MRPVWSLLLAGVCLAVLASASIAARPARTQAAVTFTLVTSPKCDTGNGEVLVGNGCYRNIQGTHLTVGSGAPSGSADFATNPAEGGAQWKDHFTWQVPQTLVAGTKIASGIQISVTVSDVKPEQPLQQGIKGFAPGFAEQIIAQYPSNATASKAFDYTLPAGQTSDFTITIEFVSSTMTYHYAARPRTTKCKVFAAAAATTTCLESFRFFADAHHPARVRAPTGRLTKRGWRVTTANAVLMTQPTMTYYETESTTDPTHGRDITIRVKVTGTDVLTSGAATVAKIDVTVIEAHGPLSINKPMRCAIGSRGSIAVVDDHRLLPGADHGQTRDKVIVNLPACPYFSHAYSNADSLVHEPFDGGQRATVKLTTSG